MHCSGTSWVFSREPMANHSTMDIYRENPLVSLSDQLVVGIQREEFAHVLFEGELLQQLGGFG